MPPPLEILKSMKVRCHRRSEEPVILEGGVHGSLTPNDLLPIARTFALMRHKGN
jgi:hypothetical protein